MVVWLVGFFAKMSKAFWPLILTMKLVDRLFTREGKKVFVTILSSFKKRVGTWVRWLDALRVKNRSSKNLALVENSVQF